MRLDGPNKLLLYLLSPRDLLLTSDDAYLLLLSSDLFLNLARPLLLEASLVNNFDLLDLNFDGFRDL